MVIKIWESLTYRWQLKLEKWIKSPRKSKEQKIKLGVGFWETTGPGRRRENSHVVKYWQRGNTVRTSFVYATHTTLTIS